MASETAYVAKGQPQWRTIAVALFFVVAARICMNLLLRAPYLYYDEQIYFWVARHYAQWGAFMCGMDVFPKVRIAYQWLIAPLTCLPFDEAYRSMQALNWFLLMAGLACLSAVFMQVTEGMRPRWRAKLVAYAVVVAGLSPAYWVTGQILPETLLFAILSAACMVWLRTQRIQGFVLRSAAHVITVLLLCAALAVKAHAAFAVVGIATSIVISRTRRPWLVLCALLGATVVGLTLVTSAGRGWAWAHALLYVAIIPDLPWWHFATGWLFNTIRYGAVGMLSSGVVPALALLLFCIRQRRGISAVRHATLIKITWAVLTMWLLGAVVIGWFATWRTINYLQADIFERYFGVTLPLLSGVGLILAVQTPRITRRLAVLIALGAVAATLTLAPLLGNRVDENGPGCLVYYCIAQVGPRGSALALAGAMVLLACACLRARRIRRVTFTLVLLSLMFLVSGLRLQQYSGRLWQTGQPYWAMIQQACRSTRPFILLSVGIDRAWFFPRVRAHLPWIEYDITGISNREMTLQLAGHAMIAGSKYVAAPSWYKLDYPVLAATNAYVLYDITGGSSNMPPGFIDCFEGLDPAGVVSPTNYFTFMLPGITNRTARASVELRTDNLPRTAHASVCLQDVYNTNATAYFNVRAQHAKVRMRLPVTRPSLRQPFALRMIVSTNWPLLRAYVDFPLPQNYNVNSQRAQ